MQQGDDAVGGAEVDADRMDHGARVQARSAAGGKRRAAVSTSISLPPALANYIDALVGAGAHASASEAVRAARMSSSPPFSSAVAWRCAFTAAAPHIRSRMGPAPVPGQGRHWSARGTTRCAPAGDRVPPPEGDRVAACPSRVPEGCQALNACRSHIDVHPPSDSASEGRLPAVVQGPGCGGRSRVPADRPRNGWCCRRPRQISERALMK